MGETCFRAPESRLNPAGMSVVLPISHGHDRNNHTLRAGPRRMRCVRVVRHEEIQLTQAACSVVGCGACGHA